VTQNQERKKTEIDGALGIDAAEFIRTHAEGKTSFDLATGMEKAIAAVRAYPHKSASVKLMLVIDPMQKGDPSRVFVTAEVTVKAPQAPAPKKVFFVTETNGLSREDPNQVQMDLGEGRKAEG